MQMNKSHELRKLVTLYDDLPEIPSPYLIREIETYHDAYGENLYNASIAAPKDGYRIDWRRLHPSDMETE